MIRSPSVLQPALHADTLTSLMESRYSFSLQRCTFATCISEGRRLGAKSKRERIRKVRDNTTKQRQKGGTKEVNTISTLQELVS